MIYCCRKRRGQCCEIGTDDGEGIGVERLNWTKGSSGRLGIILNEVSVPLSFFLMLGQAVNSQ
jgi:hypothetical protein